jgi:hypothetical protein
MKIKDIKPWEWAVAAVPLLLAIVRVVLAVTGDTALDNSTTASRVYFIVARVLYDAVVLWAIWCIYRMARWQERKSTVFLVFFIVMLLDAVYSLLQYFLPIEVKTATAVTAAFGFVMFVVGIVAIVRLFHDGVKPLGTIMVLYIVVPLAINIMLPIVMRAYNPVASALVGVLSALLVSLMFLFRNARERWTKRNETQAITQLHNNAIIL